MPAGRAKAAGMIYAVLNVRSTLDLVADPAGRDAIRRLALRRAA